MFVFAYFMKGRMNTAFRKNRERIAEINAGVEDNLSGIRVVKSFANEQCEIEKFRASNEQRTTREFSSMLLTNPPTIENMPDNSQLRKKDIEKLKKFVVNNLELLLKLANGEIDYVTEFLPKVTSGSFLHFPEFCGNHQNGCHGR